VVTLTLIDLLTADCRAGDLASEANKEEPQ
jgi:hypothetical protein